MRDLLNSSEYKFVVNYFKSMDFADREVYANWLAQTYYFVCHSTRLSALGASRLSVDDPVGKRMFAHTIEEKGHHMLALKDLEELGKDIKDYQPYGVTNALYQAQYYRVLFEEPHYLLGQIFMLESFAADACPWQYEIVRKSFGEKASRFVKVHAAEDSAHVNKALEVMSQFPPHLQAGLRANFMQACELYFYILHSANGENFSNLCRRSLKNVA